MFGDGFNYIFLVFGKFNIFKSFGISLLINPFNNLFIKFNKPLFFKGIERGR
jgi:hypothetical protein